MSRSSFEADDWMRGGRGGFAVTVVISEDLWWELPEWFGRQYSVSYDPTLVEDRGRLLRAVESAHALIVRNKTRVDAELLAVARDLRVIGRLGVGLDNIDMDACDMRGVSVVVARGANGDAVAEYVLSCMLMHARSLHRADVAVRGGGWDRRGATGNEIGGKTLGLIGMGDIAQRVARRAAAFDMKIIGYDPYVPATHPMLTNVRARLLGLTEVLREADFLSLHVPLTLATRHLIGAKALAQMKPTSVLVNTARGGVVDEAALLDWLRGNPNCRAFLDVRENEPPPADDALFALANVTLTPHIAGITHESSERVAASILKQVDRVLSRTQAGEFPG